LRSGWASVALRLANGLSNWPTARGAPTSVGWSVTHWSLRSLAQAEVEQEVVETIHHITIGDFLRAADPHLRWGRCIQPHRVSVRGK